MLDSETIERLRGLPEWAVLENHIRDTVESLSRIPDEFPAMTDAAIALEVLARKRAAETLKEILQPFVDYQEPRPKPDLKSKTERAAGL